MWVNIVNPTKDLTKSTEYSEATLCGSLLLDANMIGRVAHLVAPEDFTFGHYGKMYGVILKLWRDGLEVEPALVAAELDETDRELPFDTVEAVGSAVNAPHLAEKIADAANRRKVVSECRKGAKAAATNEDSVVGVIGGVQENLAGIIGVSDSRSIEASVIELQKDSEEAAKNPGGVSGVSTGYKVLDKVTGGLNGGDLVVIGARPSVGKTAFGVNILDNINLDNANGVCNTNTMLFSLEMTRKQVLLRMIARDSGIDLTDLRRGALSANQWVEYNASAQSVSKRVSRAMFIDDKPRATIGYISGMVRSRQAKTEVKVVMIDYLQLMGVEGRFEGRVTELNHITSRAKEMAKELDVCVMLLSQIGRAAEDGKAMSVPILSNLKGSGSIEEDADIVIMPHREYRDSPTAKIILGKNRNGETGSFKLGYKGSICSFEEVG